MFMEVIKISALRVQYIRLYCYMVLPMTCIIMHLPLIAQSEVLDLH